MNFVPLARYNILLGCFLITCLKWSLIHFQIAVKMNFDPLLIFDAIIGTKVEQNSFWWQFESGPNFILNTWSENSPIICNISQVDQSSFGLHILHVIRSPSHSLLDQNSYPRVKWLRLSRWGWKSVWQHKIEYCINWPKNVNELSFLGISIHTHHCRMSLVRNVFFFLYI